jgi:hypothetical protein
MLRRTPEALRAEPEKSRARARLGEEHDTTTDEEVSSETTATEEPDEAAADDTATTDLKDDRKYLAAVERCKAITASISGKQWRLGDESDYVGKVYGENKLKQFTVDIHFDGEWTTLQRYRDVCRAFPKSRGRPRYFAAAQVLAPYPEPERFEIVERNPDISVHEAREVMRQWRESQGEEEDGDAEDDRDEDVANEEAGNAVGSKQKKARASKTNKETEAQRNAKRTLRQLREIANNAARLAAFAGEEIAPERLDEYAAHSSDRTLIEDLRKGGTALLRAAEFLAGLSTEAATVGDGTVGDGVEEAGGVAEDSKEPTPEETVSGVA